jgi:hypothetical protein
VSHVYLVAAEDSGDAIGADVIDAMRAADPGVRISGIGGERMRAKGAAADVDMSGLAVLGLIEGLKAYHQGVVESLMATHGATAAALRSQLEAAQAAHALSMAEAADAAAAAAAAQREAARRERAADPWWNTAGMNPHQSTGGSWDFGDDADNWLEQFTGALEEYEQSEEEFAERQKERYESLAGEFSSAMSEVFSTMITDFDRTADVIRDIILRKIVSAFAGALGGPLAKLALSLVGAAGGGGGPMVDAPIGGGGDFEWTASAGVRGASLANAARRSARW